MPISFKEFFKKKEPVDKMREVAKVYLEHCAQWPDLSRPLSRSSDSHYEEPTIQEPRRRGEPKGGSELFQEWFEKNPAWKHVPARSRSVFCTTAKKPLGFGSHSYKVIPFDNTSLAMIPTDFNVHKVKIGNVEASLGGFQNALVQFGTMRDPQLKDLNIPSLIHGARDFIKDSPEGDISPRLFAVARAGTEFFTPENVGVTIFNNPAEFEFPSKDSEVWFSGKSIWVPEGKWKQFVEAVKFMSALNKKNKS